MAVEYNWPAKDKACVIGTRVDRLDGLAKSTGAAKYTYDVNLKDMLIAKALGCPHPHCRIKGIDTAAAEKVPGVVHVHVLAKPKTDPKTEKVTDPEINWQGELLAIVAAETEAAARQGVAAIKVDYEILPSLGDTEDLKKAEALGRAKKGAGSVKLEREPGEGDDDATFADKELARLFAASKYVVEGYYGIDVITHCCLEPHGATTAWNGEKLTAYLSTQNVSGTDEQFAGALKTAAGDVEVICQYIGGGFGSKFAPDYWGIAAAEIAKKTGRPVKLMLDRDQELKLGGNRPSGYIKVKLGADADGVVQVWDSSHWGTGGHGQGGVSDSVIPYVFLPKNMRRTTTNIATNTAPLRAWRAPNHPQGCAMSQTALDDLAAKMGADSYDIFLKNLPLVQNRKADVYQAEMEVAAKLMDWKAKWHPHGKGAGNGDVVEGLGMALHTWGGAGHASTVTLKIHPDGAIETLCGTQDLGTGTRTICAMVVAETFALPAETVRLNIGSSKRPASGPSGGSTTVGGVAESHRRASQDALAKIIELVAKKLEVEPATLEPLKGRIQVKGGGKSLSWKEACSLLELKPLEVTATYTPPRAGQPKSPLSSSQVGGVQMAHVAVDRRTGVVKMKKFVAVQDMGLILNPKLAESQIYGAVIMGIAYALFEQRITDAKGNFLNAELANYKLPRIGDIGEIVVELYEPESERARGVIGLGEPPVIAPGAAIANSVANALGVRIPVLPITPKRVLDTLARVKA